MESLTHTIQKTENKEIYNMATSVQAIKDAVAAWELEDDKFEAGNNAAGTRARKALQELAKLVKARRNEITATKNERKAAK